MNCNRLGNCQGIPGTMNLLKKSTPNNDMMHILYNWKAPQASDI
jgi:hypothetical protein